MSLILAVQCGDEVLMAADRFVGNDSWKMHTAVPKLFRMATGDGRTMLIGAAGDVRFSNLLRQMALSPDDSDGELDAEAFLTLVFVNRLRQHLSAHGYLTNDAGRDTMGQAALLVALDGRLFTIYETFEVCEFAQPYAAIGAAADIAIGALAALHHEDVDWPSVSHLVGIAMEAVAQHSPWVSAGTYDVETAVTEVRDGVD